MTRLHYLKHLRFAWRAAAEASPGQPRSAARELIEESLAIGQRATQTNTAVVVARMAARFAAQDKDLQALVRRREDLEAARVFVEQQLSAVLALPPEQRASSDDTARARLVANAGQIAEIDQDLKQRFPAARR